MALVEGGLTISSPAGKIAEVIEAQTTLFTAQCYELYGLPALGSLVRTGDVYGIVASAATVPLEAGRRPVALGHDVATEEAVFRENPQLGRLFRSEFSAVVVGFREGERVYQYLPALPARIHGFVYLCGDEEVRTFSRSLGFLETLLHAVVAVPPEELVSASLRQMSRKHADPDAFLIAAGKMLAHLLSDDYPRLRSILGRLR
ncbi:MAG: hypothetical protein N2506_04650 [Dehalococcoidales bacterium]|nr:hypothetical protein [Dehalococcoidales bacterium]